MEYWDLYDKNRNKLDKVVKRGDTLADDEYHLVINAWIRNKKNEFLITQRSANKKFAFMWECTGGSALKGETSLEAAMREVHEELGITVDATKAKLIGSTLRQYPNCPDILDVWLFESDVSIDDVTVQEEEVCNVMWANVDRIKELYDNHQFEANAFFQEALKQLEEEVYYIGFNANNAICNDTFFKGSITLYPTKEKGNIYFSDRLISDTKSEKFLATYKKYIHDHIVEIQNENANAKFICFNEKISKLCIDMEDANIVKNNQSELTALLNNKFKTRDLFQKDIPTLEYTIVKDKDLNYESLREKLKTDKFVIQGETGAGGDNTYLITKEEDMSLIKHESKHYSVSQYIKHTPLNITLVIGKKDIVFLPLSTQLILLTDHRFKYVGGDFAHARKLKKKVKDKVNEYSMTIAKKLQEMGYRGILGIDYLLCDKDQLVFMEINPRFQSSSFLISLYLQKKYAISIAELHYAAITDQNLPFDLKMDISDSYLNCNQQTEFKKLLHFKTIKNGYFKENTNSNYRKIFARSILLEYDFEKLEKCGII